MNITRTQLGQVIDMGHESEQRADDLRAFINDMNEDEQAELVAIMWIGREAFAADEWDTALETALYEATTPSADYLLGTPHFADHLEAGAEALGLQVEHAYAMAG